MAACIVGFLLFYVLRNARKVRQLGRFVSVGTAAPHKKIPPETAKIVIWWDFYVIVPLRGTHFQPFGKDGHTRRFHFCGNEVGSNRRSLLPSSLHSG